MSLRQNAFVLVVLAVLVAILAIWSGSSIAANAWRVPLALLLLGLAYEAWVVRRAQLSARIEAPDQLVLGRRHASSLVLHHVAGRALRVEVAPDAPEGVTLDRSLIELIVADEGGARAALSLSARRLGEFRWPALRARIAGPLGLAWWPHKLSVAFTCRSIPENLKAQAVRAGAAALGFTPRIFLGAGAEVLQLREYRPGDPQHLIDWKATARADRLISRDYSEDQHLEIVIAVDAGRTSGLRAGELDRLGHYANVSARLAELAIGQDDRVGLVVFAEQPLAVVPPARGMSAVLRIRSLLKAARVLPSESNPLNAALRVRTLVHHRSLVVLLTDLDDATTAGQLASAVRLLLPKHLPFVAGMASPQAQALAWTTAREWTEPYEALAAQEYSKRLERNVQALRALGAPTVLARPDELERAVLNAYVEFRRRRTV